jgi:hypothetical protein
MHRRWLKPILKYVLGLAVLAFVVARNWRGQGGAPGIADVLAGPINAGPLGLAAGLLAAAVLLTFVRWYVLAQALDLPLPPHEALRLGLIGYFFNTLLPGSIGGDLVKAAALVRTQERRTRAVSSVIIDRLVGLMGLVVLAAASGPVFRWAGGSDLAAQPAVAAIARMAVWTLVGSAAVWLLLGLLPEWRAQRFAGRLTRIPRLGGVLAEFWQAIWLYRQRPGAVAVALGLAVVNNALNVLAFHTAVRVFAGESAELPTLAEDFVLVPVGLVVKALFPAPGGAGGGEYGYGKLYQLAGRPAALGVLGSLAFLILSAGLGAVAYFVGSAMRTTPAAKADTNDDV